jgi:signal transduction histidine kinase
MLSRLRVQHKLVLLLMLPLIAVVAMSVPFTVSKVDEALAASSTVERAQRARQVATLIQNLQEERLLALTYLVSDDADREAFRLAIAASDYREHRVKSSLTSQDRDLNYAISNLARLKSIRSEAMRRAGSPMWVDRTYHDLVVGLVESLNLTQQARADATGFRQLGTFDALLRINEDMTRISAALVIGTVDAANATKVITETLVLVEADIARFRQQADASQAAMLSLVVQGQTAQRINKYARQISTGGLWVAATKALTTAEAALTLTRALQERIAWDISNQATERASDARVSAGTVVGLVTLVALGVILLSIAMSQAISRPLRRLTAAAATVADLASAELVRVADSEVELTRPPNLVAVPVTGSDEVGELAMAFNRVQATAAQLMEQQVATRRNIAVMFANIARRTRSLVSRQLNFIDDLERNEREDKVLGKLYRLDHLTTRLHRSADSLLVISGIREEERLVEPVSLVNVIRSAIAEIEGYQVVRVGSVCPVVIAAELVTDLRLVLAELLENAAAFSPPTATVDISARVDDDVEIVILDQGIGIPDDRIYEENRRLVERERLDVAPTSVLGLFVVGRLARRHGMRVQLHQRKPQGTAVEIHVPPSLFSNPANRPSTIAEAVNGSGQQLELPRYPDPHATRELPRVPELPQIAGPFGWFGGSPRQLPDSGARAARTTAVPQRVPSGAFPVVRQQPGPSHQHLVEAATRTPDPLFDTAATMAGDLPHSGDTSGLTRRSPGDNLRYFGFHEPKERDVQRDAAVERDQMEAFTRGMAEAGAFPPPGAVQPTAGGVYTSASASPSPAPGQNSSFISASQVRTSPSSAAAPPATPELVPVAARTAQPVPMATSRGGLTRRVPGAHLSPTLRSDAEPGRQRPAPRSAIRNPEAERDALHSFLDGLARAEAIPTPESAGFHHPVQLHESE